MKSEKPIPLSPFHCPIALRRLSRPEFDEMSRLVMAHVFASRNELGRLCDEVVYQNDIALPLCNWVNLHHHKLQLVTITR